MTASFRFLALGIALFSLSGCASPRAQSSSPIRAVSGGPTPPVAPQRPHVVRSPNGDRVDEYYWMRDDTRKDPEVLGYMRAENAYKDALLAPLAAAEKQLLTELIARIPQEDESVPARENGYEYWTRYVRGGEYPIHLRRRIGPGAPEEVLLDGNAMAQGHDFFQVANVRAQNYPALYVTTGLWDSQVQYWEPLKWVARLRARKQGDRALVLRMNMDAGHGGKSGRFAAQQQKAEEYAFLLDQVGVRVQAAQPPASN